MAVAVKNTPEAASSAPLARMPILSLVGVAYILVSLVIVFKGIPDLLGSIVPRSVWESYPFALGTVQVFLIVAALVGLVVLGGQLHGQRTAPGLRAGIFVGLVLLLVVVALTRWVSLWLEYWLYWQRWIGDGKYAWSVGAALTAVAGVVLLVAGLRWFLKPSTEKLLITFEEQGWFSASAYKRLQGQRVRRGTILGLLILVGAGVFSLWAHKTLTRGPVNWEVNIPFTDRVAVKPDDAGDALSPVTYDVDPAWAAWAKQVLEAEKEGKPLPPPLTLNRYVLRDINDKIDPRTRDIKEARFVKIGPFEQHLVNFTLSDGKKVDYRPGDIIPRAEFDEVKRQYKEQDKSAPDLDVVLPQTAWGETTYSKIVLLPHVQYTLPLLLLGLALWVSWRIVNLPTFADFLIATEAEMNKVSWTTRKRLYQDTIVVLATMFLLAGYLFIVDQVWSHVLSWRPVGVIVMNNEEPGTTTNKGGADRKPW